MKIGFSQTAVHSMHGTVSDDFLNKLPEAIHQHTGLNYSCTQTGAGYFLKPSFRNIPYRNSFIPEINLVVSQNSSETAFQITGKPVKFVRVFMGIWFGFLLVIEAILLAAAAASGIDSLFPVFIPVVMIVFGYLLCETATKSTFQTVVKAIEIEFP